MILKFQSFKNQVCHYQIKYLEINIQNMANNKRMSIFKKLKILILKMVQKIKNLCVLDEREVIDLRIPKIKMIIPN